MFALDGDVLQQALQEEDTQGRQSATPTSDDLHDSFDGMEKDGGVEGELSKSEPKVVENGRQGIIRDLPAGIRVSQGGSRLKLAYRHIDRIAAQPHVGHGKQDSSTYTVD